MYVYLESLCIHMHSYGYMHAHIQTHIRLLHSASKIKYKYISLYVSLIPILRNLGENAHFRNGSNSSLASKKKKKKERILKSIPNGTHNF